MRRAHLPEYPSLQLQTVPNHLLRHRIVRHQAELLRLRPFAQQCSHGVIQPRDYHFSGSPPASLPAGNTGQRQQPDSKKSQEN